MAKMFTHLAEHLDCTIAALREMTKQTDAVAAENEDLKKAVTEFNELYGQGLSVANWHLNCDLELLDNCLR